MFKKSIKVERSENPDTIEIESKKFRLVRTAKNALILRESEKCFSNSFCVIGKDIETICEMFHKMSEELNFNFNK